MKMQFSGGIITTECPDCQAQFSTPEAFQLHYEEQHRTVKLEPGESHNDCQSSRSQSQLQSSKTTRRKFKFEKKAPETKAKVLVLACQNCSYVTKTEHLLQEHIQTQHNPHRKIYSCHLCDYFCLQERTFHLHKLKHSELDAKFACDQCGKLFLSMGIMKRHALTHNKLKSFICEEEGCGKTFNIKSRLTDHVRYVHNRKSFKSRNNVQNKNSSSHKNSDSMLVLGPTPTSSESCNLYNSNSQEKNKNERIITKNSDKVKDFKTRKKEDIVSCNTFKTNKNCDSMTMLGPVSSESCYQYDSNSQEKNETQNSDTGFKTGKNVAVSSCDGLIKTDELGPALNTDNVHDCHKPIHVQVKRGFQVKDETHSESDVITVYDIVLSNGNTDHFSKDGVKSKSDISTTTTPVSGSTSIVSSDSTGRRNQYVKSGRKNKMSKFVCSFAGCGKSFRDHFNLRMHTCTHTGEMQRACKLCGYTCVQKSALDKHMSLHERRNALLNEKL